MNPITVVVKRIGQADVSVTVESGTTVKDVLRVLDISAQGWTMRYDGYNVSSTDALSRSGALFLTKAIRGN